VASRGEEVRRFHITEIVRHIWRIVWRVRVAEEVKDRHFEEVRMWLGFHWEQMLENPEHLDQFSTIHGLIVI
jgi:hypothetical protein